MSLFLSCYKYPLKCANNFNAKLKNIPLKKVLNQVILRKLSQQVSNNEAFVPFLDVIQQRRDEANRTILVQVQSAQSYKELHTYCNSVGSVKNMLHYTTGVVEPLHFILVEFSEESDVQNILSASSHILENQAVPTHSQFLWFRASNRKLNKLKQSKQAVLTCENGLRITSDEDIKLQMSRCETLSEQMHKLHDLTKLNDLGIRLRYLTAKQVESTVSGIFPLARAYPFGSSVNGYGKMGCDLDVVLRLTDQKEKEDSRLIFHCKASQGSERSMNQRNMEAIGDLIHLFLPGCNQVRRILQARVPIIKYSQQLTDVECDLSMTNMSGVYMSDFLYIMGELDERVRPLVFTIRKWAWECGLTFSSPGRWITNFSLTLLVLAFLQKPLNSPPVLPSLNTLVKQSGSNDKFVTEDGINCTFLRDIKKLNFKAANKESVESLLLEFFEHYAQFDFDKKAVCLNEAVALTKPEHSAMYIVNPLERGLNVSKNVSLEEVTHFQLELRNAAWIMESQENKPNFGLLSLFEKKRNMPNLNFTFTNNNNNKSRLMDISKLFEEDRERSEVEYKNESVKKEVEKIKKQTKTKLSALERSQNS